MSRKYPLLSEICRSAAVSTSPERGFTREMRDAQSELANTMPDKSPTGIVLPFYTGELRGMTATGTTSVTGDQGGLDIAHDIPEIGSSLRANFILEKMGARVFGGLRGNAGFPRAKAGLSASWLSETAAATPGNFNFDTLDLTPKRVTAVLDVSSQILMQQEGAERFLRQELMAVLAEEIQRVLIAGSGTGGEPLGITNKAGLGSVVGGTNGAIPSYSNLCDLEYAVTGPAKADRGHTGWLCSPLVRKKLRQIFMNGTGSPAVWSKEDAYSLLGHMAGVTPSAPDNLTKGTAAGICSAIVFGEMSELIVGLWGPGIIVDAVSSVSYRKQGMIALVATAFVDGGVRSPEAFAIMSDALAT